MDDRHRSKNPGTGRAAFTLVELLVSMSVLVLLLGLILQLFGGAAAVAGRGNRQMDADSQARALLDRLSVDFTRMVRRADVDYYLKGRPSANNQKGGSGGSNDQIAFYSNVGGYVPSAPTPGAGAASPVSLVAYRVNATTLRLERLGKGLVWNGDSSTNTPMVFLPIPLASPLPSPLPSPTPAAMPTPAWRQAANADPDPDYEPLGPQVFRFEYYYQLKGQSVSGTNCVSILSDTPWDTRPPINHTAVNGLQDVAAIAVTVAVIDPKSRELVSDAQLNTLSAQMNDFATTMKPGDLEAQWRTVLDASPLPRVAAGAIRVYSRYFPLDPATR